MIHKIKKLELREFPGEYRCKIYYTGFAFEAELILPIKENNYSISSVMYDIQLILGVGTKKTIDFEPWQECETPTVPSKEEVRKVIAAGKLVWIADGFRD